MRVLLVEDDEFKRAEVTAYLRELLPDGAALVNARSVQSASRALLDGQFSFVILDMSLPTFDVSSDEHGGRPQPLGGKEVLNQMERHAVAVSAVVLTQFPRFERVGSPDDELDLAELDRDLRRNYGEIYRGAVFYDTQGTWRAELSQVLERVLSTGGGER
jgi:CheY-like chemotaxis protein